jgi:hypothetical protein
MLCSGCDFLCYRFYFLDLIKGGQKTLRRLVEKRSNVFLRRSDGLLLSSNFDHFMCFSDELFFSFFIQLFFFLHNYKLIIN